MMLERAEDINPDLLQKIYPFVHALRKYHHYEAIGLEHIPQSGPAIIAANHSLATYDISLLFLEIYDRLGRIPRPLADHLFFRLPKLGEMIEAFGAVEGKPENAKMLLRHGELIGVAPGGMREALRPSSERYQILWQRRKGFVRLSLETGAPIILAVCPKADDLYEVYTNPLTAWVYKKFRVPFFFAKGLAFTPIPRPARLTHFLSEPLYPPKPKDDALAFKKQLDQFHQKVIRRTQSLIGQAIAYRPPASIEGG